MNHSGLRVATDIGGTFTDLVCWEHDSDGGGPGTIRSVKVDTTPDRLEAGLFHALDAMQVEPAAVELLVHGSTVVINALTERRGAKVGLLTTRGFRDVLEIARGNREDLYNYRYRRQPPFVPRCLRREIDERMDHLGREVMPPALESLPEVIDDFRGEGVEAVAIALLHAYANPSHEESVRRAVGELWPDVEVTCSHEVTREWREYERTNTAVLSAYVAPRARRYLDGLNHRLSGNGFRGQLMIMQSNGGVDTVAASQRVPIAMIESGPASGVLGAAAIGRLVGRASVIALDVGGTTAKCALVEHNQPRLAADYRIEYSRTNPGYPVRVPVIDLIEIGSGGGSIASLDPAGKLQVGPQSAGAVPGPAACGRGGLLPTTTDACLLCGLIGAESFGGTGRDADLTAARNAMRPLARSLGLTEDEVAQGIIRLARAGMANALRLVSTSRGHDPRRFSLVAFGGGGPLHATALARDLGVPEVVVPLHPAVFAAFSMLLVDIRRDLVRTRVTRLEPGELTGVMQQFADMEQALRTQLEADGFSAADIRCERSADLRYFGQEFTVRVPFPSEDLASVAAVFHAEHERSYSYRLGQSIELVNLHVAARVDVPHPPLPSLPRTGRSVGAALAWHRAVYLESGARVSAPVYLRSVLEPQMQLVGPALVDEPGTTTVVLEGQELVVDPFGNLLIRNGLSPS